MIIKDFQKRNIRLENERLDHINNRHPETNGVLNLIKDTLSSPDLIQEGTNKELLAIKKFNKTPVSQNKYCVVIYKNKRI